MPVPSVAAVPPPADRQECLSSIELPKPRIVAIDLTPAACRLSRIVTKADVARLRVEARMTVAELRGQTVRRIVVIAAPEPPATL